MNDNTNHPSSDQRTRCFAVLAVAAWVALFIDPSAAAEPVRLTLTVTTPLRYTNTPLDPTIDFDTWTRKARRPGNFDPNSVEVWNLATQKRVAHAMTSDFHYGNRGRVEFVIANPQHRRFEIRFGTTAQQTPLRVTAKSFTPVIGTGDLLRFNSGKPRPVTMFFSMGLHDLNGDGRRDAVGTWNYAYRPGQPWDGVICYPRLANGNYGEMTRIRQLTTDGLKHIEGIYMSSCWGDLNGDRHLDLVVTRPRQKAKIFLNTKRKDPSGMPQVKLATELSVPGWQACRLVDLDQDGVLDLVVGGKWIRNENPSQWPFRPAKPVSLGVGRFSCFLDVNRDGRLDAISTRKRSTYDQFGTIVWQRNVGGRPPKFAEPIPVTGIQAVQCSAVASYQEKGETGLLIQHDAFQQVARYALAPRSSKKSAHFVRQGRLESSAAVMSLSDQAWPWPCDWDADGDLDLLIGGGYGWPRIVKNVGTRTRPQYAEPAYILSAGKPIRLVRNKMLGKPESWHNMGYPYPVFIDWDGDGLADLVCPNETNRIYWFKNQGTRQQPRFGKRRQILCDGYPDSAGLRTLSAKRAADRKSADGVYPREKERPFRWRTGAAIADFNGDGLMDLVTDDGYTSAATLFVQYRKGNGERGLRKAGPLKLSDGRIVDDRIVQRRRRWGESFRPVDWDRDGKMDLLYSLAGSHHGIRDGGSMYLLRNVGSKTEPKFAPPETMRCFGEPIRITNHGPHAWAGDFDGDGTPDILAAVEWSVYPFYSHAALMMKARPKVSIAIKR